jgi:hypothetical protein
MATEEEKRRDAPREGAIRWTVIIEKQYVTFLKNYSKKNNVQITQLIGDALGHWIERIKQGRERY